MKKSLILLFLVVLFLSGCKEKYKATKSAEELKLAQPSINPKSGKALGLSNDGSLTIPTQAPQQMQQIPPQLQQQLAQQQQQLNQQQMQQQIQSKPQNSNEPAAFPEKVDIPEVSTMNVSTSKGEIVISLYPDEAPGTIQNYIEKSNDGFYDGLTFHRVEDWVVQGGDPDGDGTGGETMPTELSQREFVEGSVGVARGGDINVSNDAQFFICTTDCSWLTGKYTLFGSVTEGIDIAKSIEIGDEIVSLRLE